MKGGADHEKRGAVNFMSEQPHLRIRTGEISEVLKRRSVVSHGRISCNRERTQSNSIPIHGDLGTEAVLSFPHSLEPANIACSGHVSSVSEMVCISEVLDPVVIANAVDMVNKGNRKLVVMHEPNEPVNKVLAAVYFDADITVRARMPGRGSSRPTSGLDAPDQSTARFVCEQSSASRKRQSNFACREIGRAHV